MSRQIYAIYLKCLFSLVLLVSMGLPALGQSASSAAVNGIVQDTTDARIPNASVKLINTDTGTESNSTTSKDGNFSIPSVLPGHYRLQIEREGFDTTQLTGITLDVGDNKDVIIRMKVGSRAQTVNVDGSALTINTTDASVSTVIDRKFVENIPLNGRSFQDLISMTPGVVTQSPQSNSQLGSRGDFSVNGQRTESNYYMVDGVSGNISPGNGGSSVTSNGTLAAATALGTTQSLVSVDALQEFRVESSTYSAEYGHGPGGQFSFVTRSGTNTPHGSAFEYLRNSYFDANNWFNDELGVPEPPLRQNDFGGTFGAPVRLPWIYNGTNKTFFFVSYEGLRLTQPQAASVLYVPDTALRSSASAALQPLLNAFPVQTGSEALVPCTAGATSTYSCPPGSQAGTMVQSGLAEFSKSYSLPGTIDSTSVRLDHTFGPKLAVFFRFGGTPSSTSGRSLAVVNQTKVNTYTYTLGATSQFSSRITNEFRLGYASSDAILAYTLDDFGGAVPVNAFAAVGLGAYNNPGFYFDLDFFGVGNTFLAETPSSTGARTWNLTDHVTVLHGRHRITAGVDFIRYKSLQNSFSPLGEALYFAPQGLQNNEATELATEKITNATPVFYNTAAFAQDDWQIRPRLSLSLGMRWEVDPAPTGENGNDAYTLLGSISDPSTLTLAPRGTQLWKTYWYNFAPRVGAAWIANPRRGSETVIRTGAGAFFDTYNEVGAIGFNALGFSADQISFGGSLPISPSQLDYAPSATPPYTDVYAFPAHLQVPYTLEWNVSLEQALGSDQTFTASYIGSNGRRLISSQDVSLAALNPEFGEVFIFAGGITSNYQALQTKFQRTVLHGLQALVSYTWSHSIDFGSNYATFAAMRGNSDFDVRHNLAAGASWDIPISTRNRVSQSLLEHWGLDGRLTVRTGFPITLDGNLLTDPATGNQFFSGVNLVPGKPLYLFGRQYPGGRALNGGPEVPLSNAAFTLPTGTAEGDAPRNFVRGFGENQVNLAIRRAFPIRDGISLQFRAEAFNILNHPNFGTIDDTLTDAQFGLATKTLNASLATLASQYQQGGPRSMQFALKFTF
jgi:hypothetical protein